MTDMELRDKIADALNAKYKASARDHVDTADDIIELIKGSVKPLEWGSDPDEQALQRRLDEAWERIDDLRNENRTLKRAVNTYASAHDEAEEIMELLKQ